MKRKETVRSHIAKIVLTWYTLLNGGISALCAQAGALEGTKLVQGSKNILSDASKVLMGITAVVVVVLLMWRGISYMNAGEDDGSKEKHKKAAKSVLIVGILILCAEGIVTAVFSYFS